MQWENLDEDEDNVDGMGNGKGLKLRFMKFEIITFYLIQFLLLC